MNFEFHYYITFLIAIAAGFSECEAYKIAYSSQYVDDNGKKYKIKMGGGDESSKTGENHKIEGNCKIGKGCKTGEDCKIYENLITQTYCLKDILDRENLIYPMFHFIPGDIKSFAKKMLNKERHFLCTTAGNTLARNILRKSLQTNNLYQIGIASHAFVDTWAHAGFVGIIDEYNTHDPVVRFDIHDYNDAELENPITAYYIEEKYGEYEWKIGTIGHIQALEKPDLMGEIWSDHRLKKPRIHNDKKFLRAAKDLLFEYSNYIAKKNDLYTRHTSKKEEMNAITEKNSEKNLKDKKCRKFSGHQKNLKDQKNPEYKKSLEYQRELKYQKEVEQQKEIEYQKEVEQQKNAKKVNLLFKMLEHLFIHKTAKSRRERMTLYQQTGFDMTNNNILIYHKKEWLDKAVTVRENGYYWPSKKYYWSSEKYEDEDWYKFQEAVKGYVKTTKPMIMRKMSRMQEENSKNMK